MEQELQPEGAVSEKRGVPVYRTNPSIPDEHEIKKSKRTRIGNEEKGLVVDTGTGEIIERGGAVVYEWEEVDKERFVKLYLAGLKQAAGLTKAGLAVFEIVYNQVREKPGTDVVMLSLAETTLPRTTYFRGLRELPIISSSTKAPTTASTSSTSASCSTAIGSPSSRDTS